MGSEKGRVWLRALRVAVLGALGCAMVLGGLGIAGYLMSNPLRPEQETPVKEAPRVNVAAVRRSAEQVVVSAMGTVEPAVEVTLRSEVAGMVLRKHPEFLEGGVVAEGETLLELDAQEYDLALAAAEAMVATAEADLRIEEGQQAVARHEWDLLQMEDVTEEERELALRRPYLDQRQAALKSARTQAAQARLDLDRTRIHAPFNAVIRSAEVDVGDIATTQTQLGRLVGTDAYWVLAKVSVSELQWVVFPGSEDGEGSEAIVHSPSGGTRRGRVLKLLSELEGKGRMAQVLIEATDPLALAPENAGARPLLLGDYVSVEILGRTVEDVFAIDRGAVRDGSRIWLVDGDDRLDIVEPEIVWSGADRVFVRGLEDGAMVVTSALSTPVGGMVVAPSPATATADGAGAGGSRTLAHSGAALVGRADAEAD